MRELKKAIVFCKQLQDGKLTPTTGRVEIYPNSIDISLGPSMYYTKQEFNDKLFLNVAT